VSVPEKNISQPVNAGPIRAEPEASLRLSSGRFGLPANRPGVSLFFSTKNILRSACAKRSTGWEAACLRRPTRRARLGWPSLADLETDFLFFSLPRRFGYASRKPPFRYCSLERHRTHALGEKRRQNWILGRIAVHTGRDDHRVLGKSLRQNGRSC
jgi:hypothetical protein